MNGPQRAAARRNEREYDQMRATAPQAEVPRPSTEAENAADTLRRNGTGRGYRVNGIGEEMSGDYLQRTSVSKDGTAVIVRLTPDQALWIADLIMQNED